MSEHVCGRDCDYPQTNAENEEIKRLREQAKIAEFTLTELLEQNELEDYTHSMEMQMVRAQLAEARAVIERLTKRPSWDEARDAMRYYEDRRKRIETAGPMLLQQSMHDIFVNFIIARNAP